MDLRITHVGGPTVLLELNGWRLLTDPTFDPPGQRYRFGWGTSSTKLAGPAMAIEDIGHIDAVLLSHDHHADNLDGAGRRLLPSVERVITTTSGSNRVGGGAIGLDDWESTLLEAAGRPSIRVTATPCRHGPPLSRPLVGDVIGFALEVGRDPLGALWISGDTVLFDGVREVPERLNIAVAVLHLGCVKFSLTGPVHYSMTAAEAAEMCALLHPALVLPVHYEGWSHFRQGRTEVERELSRVSAGSRPRVRWLPIGESVDVTVASA